MSDLPNNEFGQSAQNPAPINVPEPRPSRRVVNFPPYREDNLGSTYDPPVTIESQEAHGEPNVDNVIAIDSALQPIEEDDRHTESSTFPRRVKRGPPTTPTSRKFHRSRNQTEHPFSFTYTPSYSSDRVPWSVLRSYNDRYYNDTLPGTPSPARLDNSYQSGVIYDDPHSISPGEESLFSVIMDDGSKQRRRISLTSEPSRNAVSEQTPLLHKCNDSDSDESNYDQNQHHKYDNSLKARVKDWFHKNTFTPNQKNIIKCALAYFIASLFTFIPILNEWSGLVESKDSHLIASVAVFYNPAKTVGGIYEAVIFALIGGLYGSLVGIGSMACAVWFNDQGYNTLGHIVTIVFWCGGSMFIVAFLKAKLNKPTFNSVITKEGATHLGEFRLDKIISVTKIVLIGTCISFLVSVCIWPVSASKKLKTEIGNTLGSFNLLLKLLTKTFLIDDIHYTDKTVQSAIASYRKSFTSLEASLYQASLEIHNLNMRSQLGLYKEVIKSLHRLAQHLGGLRSCCGLQWEIIKDEKIKSDENSTNQMNSPEGLNKTQRQSGHLSDDEEFGDLSILLDFIRFVGPPMKSLVFTCKQTLSHLQDQFIQSPSAFSKTTPTLLQQNLKSALNLFEKSQSRSLTGLYRKENTNSKPNEEVFLIYFFVFNLQEFTRELTDLIDLVGRIQNLDAKEQGIKETRKWWQFWIYFGCFKLDASNDSLLDKKSYEKAKDKFPENTNNLFDTIQTPRPKTLTHKLTIKIWQSLSWFRQFEVKYAIKAAVSTAILASPAFIEETRDIYREYRGEWACISLMVVMAPTVGGTNLIGIYRAAGTLFGSYLAWVIYTLFPDNGLVISILGFFIAMGCFHMILYTKYNRIGTFILLTYNLVALYKFNLKNSDNEDENLDLIDIARYRAIAVATGIIWGVFVTTYWWPYEARVELRKGLSQLFVNMSWLYKKLVSVYSVMPEVQPANEGDVTSSSKHSTVRLTPQASHRLSQSTKEFMDMELILQVSLLKLTDLLAQTPNEPRMKGPFPIHTYSEILTGCQNILDKLLSMRIAVTQEEWYKLVRRDFIIPMSKERKELVGNVLLYFYILAAALRLKTPLPPYLPPAEKARRRLVKKIRNLPVVKQRIIEDEHYIIYYAYALVMEDIIRELERLGVIMQELFGCMGGDEFNTLFAPDENSIDDVNEESITHHDDGASGVAPSTN
ncbi:7037_t:CDS:2 [Funneliformis mosseae]|uniref:7037_t:CDS:1 n=1 Tax=Funneliformis mosseae TaxID=27381 RepID=A0A9N8V419_FUNMO|nr:7037_t:CDS:2 [Funneliformis mosseae]